MRLAFLLLLASFSAAFAQDERRVLSPDGQLEFRIFIAEQADTSLSRIAYQVWSKQHCLVETSFLGLDVWEQEPLLGENEGLIDASTETRPAYNGLLARYMQNGSTGRAIDVEIRVYNRAVTFRYRVPRSNMLEHLYLNDETTEFAVKDDSISIVEIPKPGFPRMQVVREEGDIRRVRLARGASGAGVVFDAGTPLTGPWRVLLMAGATLPPDL